MSAGADVVVIGGGIAGVTAAYHAAIGGAAVVLLEREPVLAHHTTGRSAAQYLETYGGPVNQRLTIASRDFFDNPPSGLVDAPLLSPCPFLSIGTEADRDDLVRTAAANAELVPSTRVVEHDEIVAMCPVLTLPSAAVGVVEPDAQDIDVMALHQAFVRGVVAAGGRIERAAPVHALDRRSGHWVIRAGSGEWSAPLVVNAAGAWGDEVAALARVVPVGLTPLRRTAFTVGAPVPTEGWPLVHPVREGWYFKPEAGGQLLCSLADETPSPPCDARAEELDVALAMDRINGATTLGLRSVRSAWAGLRTFAPDRDPVIGTDDAVEGFAWMVGQGGTGIQTAPAAGRAVASLVLEGRIPEDLVAAGLTATALAPRR